MGNRSLKKPRLGKYDIDALRRLNRGEPRATPPGGGNYFTVDIRTAETGGKAVPYSDLLWLGEGCSICAPSFRIDAPMTYGAVTSRVLPEDSCVYANYPVDSLPPEPLDYWPCFSRMTPSQRGAYLRWLAGGRRGHLDDIGYAFVYFYGLERRALGDGQDIPWIMEETRRLLLLYSASRSFRKYAGSFLTLLFARSLAEPEVTEERLLDLHSFLPVPQEKTFPLLLGWYAFHGVHLSPQQAFYVMQNLPAGKSNKTGTKTAPFPAEARELFFRRYLQACPRGMKVTADARSCYVKYNVASASFRFWGDPEYPPSARIPNVLGKRSQFGKLAEIRASCLENGGEDFVLVRRAKKRSPGEPLKKIPEVNPNPPLPVPVEIRIDMARVARLREESDDIARKLAAVFEGNEPIAASSADNNKVNQNPPVLFPRGLDAKYAPVLRALAERAEKADDRAWSREEWKELSRRCGFMPDALLEDLNTWAEETLGDSLLLEDDRGLTLNREVYASV